MPLTSEDRLAITDLVALHGHLFDEGELGRLDELFTADVVYDASDFGQEPMRSEQALLRSAIAIPVAHHVTNIVITPVDDDTASARSKGLGVTGDGKSGSVTYIDIVARTAAGWRISHRHLQARRHPLNGLGTKSEPLR